MHIDTESGYPEGKKKEVIGKGKGERLHACIPAAIVPEPNSAVQDEHVSASPLWQGRALQPVKERLPHHYVVY